MKRAEVNETKWTIEIDGKEYFIGEKISEQTPEQYFWELLGNYSTYADWKKYPGKVFIENGKGRIVLECNLKIDRVSQLNYLFVDDTELWKKIENKFSLSHQEISQLIKEQVEKHFNLENLTASFTFSARFFYVEEHFNLEGNHYLKNKINNL